jgi:hypothetical protein
MKNISTASIRFAIGLAATLLFGILLFNSPNLLIHTEGKLYDLRSNL